MPTGEGYSCLLCVWSFAGYYYPFEGSFIIHPDYEYVQYSMPTDKPFYQYANPDEFKAEKGCYLYEVDGKDYYVKTVYHQGNRNVWWNVSTSSYQLHLLERLFFQCFSQTKARFWAEHSYYFFWWCSQCRGLSIWSCFHQRLVKHNNCSRTKFETIIINVGVFYETYRLRVFDFLLYRTFSNILDLTWKILSVVKNGMNW